MIDQLSRDLSVKESRLLRASLSRARHRHRRALLKAGRISFAICGVLCVMTLLASGAPAWVVVGFWLSFAVLLGLWFARDERELAAKTIAALESALRHNKAFVTRIRAVEMVDFEEVEDEGACYAFQLSDSRIVFVCGQDFYSSPKFPNSDFSLVQILDECGSPTDTLIETDGKKLKPVRTIAAGVRRKLKSPAHLEVIEGQLANLEASLAG